MNDAQAEMFLAELERITLWLNQRTFAEVVVIHHNDADGLSSGAILNSAFSRHGMSVRRISLEKPYPQAIRVILDSIENVASTLVVFADFSSGMLPTIELLRPHDLEILILDHHQIRPTPSDKIHLLNPLQYGISGMTECSASTVCYLFARALNSWNSDRAAVALIGVCGDGQFAAPFRLSGLNILPYQDAIAHQLIIEGSDIIIRGKCDYPINRIVSAINALGSVGYFTGGCDLAVKGLVDGWGIEVDTCGEEYLSRYKKLSQEFLEQVKLNRAGELCWFLLGDEFQKVGVKTVGLLCEELVKSGLVAGCSYVLGVQPIAPYVPGVGIPGIEEDKVSMRVTVELRGKIERGEKKPLTEILPEATAAVGGFVDACHPHAAATTIPRGSITALIPAVTRILNGN